MGAILHSRVFIANCFFLSLPSRKKGFLPLSCLLCRNLFRKSYKRPSSAWLYRSQGRGGKNRGVGENILFLSQLYILKETFDLGVREGRPSVLDQNARRAGNRFLKGNFHRTVSGQGLSTFWRFDAPN